MKLNKHTALHTPKVLLVPYSSHHVPTYHTWMQDPDLQKATASEPLTLEEEYAMQKSWRTDTDKLTFIVCTTPGKDNVERITPGEEDAEDNMFGDVNLFLSKDEENSDDEKDDGKVEERPQYVIGEVEIMIARKDRQGKGLGKAILLAFLWYIISSTSDIMDEYHTNHASGKTKSDLKYFRVKIEHVNARSIRLFESLGFKKVSEAPNYFGELELRMPVTEGSMRYMEAEMGHVPVKREYRP